LKELAEFVKQDVGYINLFVANAGMTGPGLIELKMKPSLADFVDHVWKTPMAEFDAVYNLNCSAVFYSIIAFLKLLDEGNGSGYACKSQVIATASTASFLRNPRVGFAYTSSKAALVSMMKTFSSFCVPWGIRFNALAAGCKLLFTLEDPCLIFMQYFRQNCQSPCSPRSEFQRPRH
jgi:NAD(P)-dependent dehydrogenase (short-subunit alcohol dehydrogenase family)